MAQDKPTIVIVHGAWHHPEYFSTVGHSLESKGYEVVCPRLPTCNNAIPPDQTLSDDVALIRSTALKLADAGKEIVVLCHSYGGVVSTDALYDLSVEKRAAQNLKGGIKRLAYMCAFIPKKGEGLADIFGGTLPPWIQPQPNKTLALVNPENHFFHDTSDPEHWASLLVTHPTDAQSDPVSHEAWREIPVTYLICEGDQGLLLEFQKMMIARIEAEGVRVTTETCTASHSPFLSMPQRVVELAINVANS
ncbi:alpha/beta-hydrolase [Rhizodiscina lignyota]|uniref:Alpha/beta-hydrolase n=1 Tax=Rhizodiscina lignyota TaxID=1504668 RepID=A0A9P4IME3_9PEZI|nr:alpha/beta-hydrolase [Rhizodiscina lignyota]